MPLSPHLRAAAMLLGGALVFSALFVLLLVPATMQDQNFIRGDNLLEATALMACFVCTLLALLTSMGMAFRYRWATKLARLLIWVLGFVALAILVSAILAGSQEDRPTDKLMWAQALIGLTSVAGAFGIHRLLRLLRNSR